MLENSTEGRWTLNNFLSIESTLQSHPHQTIENVRPAFFFHTPFRRNFFRTTFFPRFLFHSDSFPGDFFSKVLFFRASSWCVQRARILRTPARTLLQVRSIHTPGITRALCVRSLASNHLQQQTAVTLPCVIRGYTYLSLPVSLSLSLSPAMYSSSTP